MNPPPFLEETALVCLNNPKCFSRIRGAHMMVQPQCRHRLLTPEADDHFTTADALHVNVRWLVFPRWCVHVHTEASLVVHPDHALM